jgi:hypothetical protein
MCVESGTLTAVMTPYSLVDECHYFGGTGCSPLQGTLSSEMFLSTRQPARGRNHSRDSR